MKSSTTTQQLARAVPVVTFQDSERGEVRVEWFFDAVTTDAGLALSHSLVILTVRREFNLKRSMADDADRYSYRVTINWSAIGESSKARTAVFSGALNEATALAGELQAAVDLWSLCATSDDLAAFTASALLSRVKHLPNRHYGVPAGCAFLSEEA